jgi:hypothetical protein
MIRVAITLVLSPEQTQEIAHIEARTGVLPEEFALAALAAALKFAGAVGGTRPPFDRTTGPVPRNIIPGPWHRRERV